MFGKSDTEKMQDAQREQDARHRRHALEDHALTQASTKDEERGGEVLRQLSEIEDLPAFEGGTLDQFVSRVISTSNLSQKDIESDRWIREMIIVLYQQQFPPENGITGAERAHLFDDVDAARDPLSPETRTEIETFRHTAGMAVSRSEDMRGVTESTRTIAEAISHEDSKASSGGLLGRFL